MKENITAPDKRTFLWMPKLDMYVLREFLIPFSVLLFAFTILFLIADVFNFLSEFLNFHAPASLAFKYFLMRMPGNIRFVLPIAVLLACMYTMANLGRHREITAMRASGISLPRCGFAIYAVAFLVTIVNFWFNEKVVPENMVKSEILFESLSDPNYAENMTKKLQFHSSDKMRSWFFGDFDIDGVQSKVKLKIFVPDEFDAEKKTPLRMIEAEKAEFVPERGWVFSKAKVTEFTRIGLPGICEEKDEYVISEKECPERPEMIERAIQLPENLPTGTIYTILKENKNMAKSLKNIYSTLFYYHLAFPWVCFFCAFLALPLSAKNERSGIFTAITTAVIVIVVYQVLTEIMMIAGKNGYLPPWFAGCFPTVVFACYGIYLVRSNR